MIICANYQPPIRSSGHQAILRYEAFESESLETTSGQYVMAIALNVENTETLDGGGVPKSPDDTVVDFNEPSPASSPTLTEPPIHPSVGFQSFDPPALLFRRSHCMSAGNDDFLH